MHTYFGYDNRLGTPASSLLPDGEEGGLLDSGLDDVAAQGGDEGREEDGALVDAVHGGAVVAVVAVAVVAVVAIVVVAVIEVVAVAVPVVAELRRVSGGHGEGKDQQNLLVHLDVRLR